MELLLMAIAAGILWGIVQAMIMVKNSDMAWIGPESGIRGHVLKELYYFFFVGLFFFFGALLLRVWEIRPGFEIITILQYICIIIGLWFAGWEFSELLYPFCRWESFKYRGRFYERLVILGIINREYYDYKVLIIHAVRIIGCIMLIYLGELPR